LDVRIGALARVWRRSGLERLRRRSSEGLKALNLRDLKLPDGQIIQAEMALDPQNSSAG